MEYVFIAITPMSSLIQGEIIFCEVFMSVETGGFQSNSFFFLLSGSFLSILAD